MDVPTNWTLALEWAEAKEKDVDDFLKKNVLDTFQPRIAAMSSSMNQVEEHFLKNEITTSNLSLYQNILRSTKLEVLAFLKSCHNSTSEELFYEMPTEIVSNMSGRPCKTRDHETLSPLAIPRYSFSKNPALLLTNSNETALFIRGNEINRISKGGKILTVLPTSDSLEQFVILCNGTPQCSLLSVTQKGIQIVCEFDLHIPEHVLEIDWIDAVSLSDDGPLVVFWGGCDPLRGQETWSFSAAIDTNSDELFYEFPEANEKASQIYKDVKKHHDFSKHGNLLTVWKKCMESEKDLQRSWKTSVSLNTASNVVANVSTQVLCAWGSPQHYVLHEKGGATSVWLCNEKKQEMKLSFEGKGICVLYALSK